MSLIAFIVLCTAAAVMVVPGLPPDLAVYAPYMAITLGLLALWVAAGMVQRGLARLVSWAFAKPKPVIVVDGSNVMHWQNDTPSVKALTLVLSDLTARGFAPHVYFDANVGYKLFDRAVNAGDLAWELDLRPSQITLAPSRTPADPLLIAHAIKAGVRVVTNDRFMDWRDQFPQIRGKGFLVPGAVKGEQVELRFAAMEAA